MFDSVDFYPTPRPVGRQMLRKISSDAQRILEPSAGTGDLAEILRGGLESFTDDDEDDDEQNYEGLSESEIHRAYYRRRSYRERTRAVDCIEIDPEKAMVLIGKKFPLVGYDWMEYNGVSYYDAIVMNPPFSNGDAHVLKAWNFLHGGEIVALLNAETIRNPFTQSRRQLANLIQSSGNVEILGQCFTDARRKTDVDVALVYLKKPFEDDSASLWSTPDTKEKEYETRSLEETMLAVRDDLGNYEHRYNMANQEMIAGLKHLRRAAAYMVANHLRSDGSNKRDSFESLVGLARTNLNAAIAEWLKSHRRDAWYTVLSNMNFHKWLDKAQAERMLREIETCENIPLTAENIKSTLENIMSSRVRLFEESCARVFDELCSHFKGNGTSEGWKTNDEYKVNEKLIFPWGCRYEKNWGFSRCYSSNSAMDLYDDLDRVVARLDGRTIDKIVTVGAAYDRAIDHNRMDAGTFTSTYFEGRYFKKGTMHLKWRRRDLWESFNKTASKGKKWIGRNTKTDTAEPETAAAEPEETYEFALEATS